MINDLIMMGEFSVVCYCEEEFIDIMKLIQSSSSICWRSGNKPNDYNPFCFRNPRVNGEEFLIIYIMERRDGSQHILCCFLQSLDGEKEYPIIHEKAKNNRFYAKDILNELAQNVISKEEIFSLLDTI